MTRASLFAALGVVAGLGCSAASKTTRGVSPPKRTVAAAPSEAAQGRAWVRMLRTHCFGMCPVYAVTVFDDGEVLWEGIDHVETRGPARARVSADDAQALISQFRSLQPPPPSQGPAVFASDHPSVVVEDGSRRVEHDHGRDQEALLGIRAFADAFDVLVQSQRWIEAGCEGMASGSAVFGPGLEFHPEVREFVMGDLDAVARHLTEHPGSLVRVRVVVHDQALRRVETVERALALRGADTSRVFARVLDPGLDAPAGWDDGVVWFDYGPSACFVEAQAPRPATTLR